LGTHLLTKHQIQSGSVTAPPIANTSINQFLAPPKDRISLEDALIHWVIETRQPFTVVEQPSFRDVFNSAGISVPVKSADTLRNRVQEEYNRYRDTTRQQLGITCRTVAVSLDLWTSENQIAILAVMGHWLTAEFEKKEKLLEFTEIEGPHSGENLAEVLVAMLEELGIAQKLLTLTGDNAGNNGTLCDSLHEALLKKYDDEDHEFRMKPLMRFRGRKSFIPCLAHVINLVCKDFLSSLKAGSVKEAKAMLDEIAAKKHNGFTAGVHNTKGAIVKIRLLVLWIARSPQRRQEWKAISPTKQVSYDVDTRWNSTYTMICDALRLRKELGEYVRSRPELSALQLTDEEWLILQQVAKVLKPFWEHTNAVSKSCPTIVESLPIYWSLDDLLDDVKNAEGDFADVNCEIQVAVEKAIRKLDKFTKKMDDNILHYVACIMDPRIKTTFIEAQMSSSDSQNIIREVRSFLKKLYPFETTVSTQSERPSGMSETTWKTLRKVRPSQAILTSDIDKYIDSPPVDWSHQLIEDGDPDWVPKWWKANTFAYPLMAQAVRDYLPVPSAEVAIERVFSGGRDVLGLRRQSMSAETMRWLMLLKGRNNGKN